MCGVDRDSLVVDLSVLLTSKDLILSQRIANPSGTLRALQATVGG